MTRDEFAEKVNAAEKKLYLSALSVVRNTEDAKDAVATAVAYAWEKLSDLKDQDRFDAWLLKITYTEAKKIKKASRAYEDITELSDAFSYEPETDDLEFLDILAHSGLDERSRIIISMRFMYGYTLEETAKELRIPLSTVKTKYYRALDRIAAKLGLK
ncbi:MAG: sigma-70 family RNA polymerase sigma factor [Clostridia bacterium]|nr:sigma-70 family RNA polymerase sigma factor [Clostridia bacterium]